jgi:hypothetical protein
LFPMVTCFLHDTPDASSRTGNVNGSFAGGTCKGGVKHGKRKR